MPSVTQPPATRERLNELVAELFGDPPTPPLQTPAGFSTAGQRWQQAVTHVSEQLRAKLRVEVLPERMRKGLELVGTHAVTLQADGSASVQSGKQAYTLSPECPCADAKHRTELCKHALAVELHRRALALFHGTAAEPAPAPRPTPAAPSASLPAAAAALPPAAPSALASSAWNVNEAPASACFKFRVGTMELMYTLRGIDDAELQRRITATLPTLQEVIEACEERAAQRAAAREAAQAAQAQPAPQAPLAPQPTSAPADLQTLVQQALQQALAAQANGAAPSTPAPDDQQTGFCSLHQVQMEQKHNERGTFYGHWLADEKRHCNGRRNGRR